MAYFKMLKCNDLSDFLVDRRMRNLGLIARFHLTLPLVSDPFKLWG